MTADRVYDLIASAVLGVTIGAAIALFVVFVGDVLSL